MYCDHSTRMHHYHCERKVFFKTKIKDSKKGNKLKIKDSEALLMEQRLRRHQGRKIRTYNEAIKVYDGYFSASQVRRIFDQIIKEKALLGNFFTIKDN